MPPAERPRRLLALDGGGIRGLITLEILQRMEDTLRADAGAGPGWVLANWFDYIGGTSTGAIIAAGLSLGMPVAAIKRFYREQGRAMFGRARLLHRLHHRFEAGPLAAALQGVFGTSRTLGSPDLRTLLLVVLRNSSTDSPWPLSSNPCALFNDPALPDCNLRLPLWQLVRASTAAPTYYPPEVVQVGSTRFVFEDGGLTPYNNPAFALAMMATAAPFRLCWPTGPDRLLLVSVGTGGSPNVRPGLAPRAMHLLYAARTVPQALIFACGNQQDLLCRAFGRTLAAPPLDAELGDLVVPQASGLPPLFTYIRYNAELTRPGLDALGLPDMRPMDVQRMDGVAHMDKLQAVGRAAAAQQVRAEHFRAHHTAD